MATADFLIIGGGIAGLSAAARLAPHGRTLVFEAEEATGYHSSGRSATFAHYGIGNTTVRGLTWFSRAFFQNPPPGFAPVPIAERASALFVATAEMADAKARLKADMSRFTDSIETLSADEALRLCPVLRTGADHIVGALRDPDGLRLDSDALLQGYQRLLKAQGGSVLTGQRISGIDRAGSDWRVTSERGEQWTAPVLVNAAGAWADQVGIMAGVRPLGLEPKRRTIIVLEPPAELDVRGWPFVKTVTDEFYMLPQGARLMASPVDEVPSDPLDAQPEDYDIALAAYRVEQYTHLKVHRIAHRWAGLRSFVADRVPTAGFAPDAPGFFWLAGQGGYGLQTAPAMAAICEALVTSATWPAELAALGVDAAAVGPDRLFRN